MYDACICAFMTIFVLYVNLEIMIKNFIKNTDMFTLCYFF